MFRNVAVAAFYDLVQQEIAAQPIVSVQSYRIAAHFAFKLVVDRREAFPTDSTFPPTGARPRTLEKHGGSARVRVGRVVRRLSYHKRPQLERLVEYRHVIQIGSAVRAIGHDRWRRSRVRGICLREIDCSEPDAP